MSRGAAPDHLAWAVGGALAVTLVATVVGLYLLDVRLGGLGYAIALVPVAILVLAAGIGGLGLIRSGAPGSGRRRAGAVLGVAAAVLLGLIAAGVLAQADAPRQGAAPAAVVAVVGG